MSIFKRAMGAVGRAGGQMANRYIDEDLAMKRAQFMADLQHNNMVRADEYQNSPERRGKLREQAAQDTIAAGAATDTAAVNRLNNPQLNDATQAKAERDARTARALEIERLNDPKLQQATDADTRRKAERDAQIQRDQVKAAAADTGYLNSVSEVALADPKAREQIKLLRAQAVAAHASASNASANAAQTRAQTEAIIRVNDLTKEMERVLDDKTIDGPTRQKRLAELNAKAAVFGGGKKSEGGGVTEEVKDVVDPKTGEVISRERNRKGPLGAIDAAEAKSDPAAQLRAGVEQARADGKINDAIAELRQMGASREQMLQAGVTEDELKAASQPTRGGPSPKPEPAPKPDPYAGMSFRERQQAIVERDRSKTEDPRIAQLEQAKSAALRSGDAVKANQIQQQINALR